MKGFWAVFYATAEGPSEIGCYYSAQARAEAINEFRADQAQWPQDGATCREMDASEVLPFLLADGMEREVAERYIRALLQDAIREGERDQPLSPVG